MIYTVCFDGINIYGEDHELMLLSPTVETELNTAGSFSFTMPPGHSFYDVPKILGSDVEVYEDGALIWHGRPIDISTDFYRQKKVYCEGALAFFNDSVQRPAEYANISLREFFRLLVERHNSQVALNRRFQVGSVTVRDVYVNRVLNYETTLDALKKLCLETNGGYFFTRREGGVSYIDWLKDIPYLGDQPVQFALNLLDLNQSISGTDIRTAVLPVGADGLTVKSVNHGLDYIESDAAAVYGRITEVVEFTDISDADRLLEAGSEWLLDRQFEPLSIEVSAAELHYINNEYTSFRVGQMVHCTSTPHLLDRDFPITKISLGLDTAVKKITIGAGGNKKLSELAG